MLGGRFGKMSESLKSIVKIKATLMPHEKNVGYILVNDHDSSGHCHLYKVEVDGEYELANARKAASVLIEVLNKLSGSYHLQIPSKLELIVDPESTTSKKKREQSETILPEKF